MRELSNNCHGNFADQNLFNKLEEIEYERWLKQAKNFRYIGKEKQDEVRLLIKTPYAEWPEKHKILNKLRVTEYLPYIRAAQKFSKEQGFVEGILFAVKYLVDVQHLNSIAKDLAMNANVSPKVVRHYGIDGEELELLVSILEE